MGKLFVGKSETCNHHGVGAASGVDEWGPCLPRGISGNKRGSSVSENDTPWGRSIFHITLPPDMIFVTGITNSV